MPPPAICANLLSSDITFSSLYLAIAFSFSCLFSDNFDDEYVAVYYLTLPSPSPSPTPTPERYLAFHNGTETKVLLLASDLRYEVYEQDIPQLRGCDSEVKKGDPCAIINVTFRNDYTEEWPAGYQIALTADLYNTEGEKVGTIITHGQLFCGFVEVWRVECGETRTFDIYVYYDKQDVDHYDLYIYNIQKYPTP